MEADDSLPCTRSVSLGAVLSYMNPVYITSCSST